MILRGAFKIIEYSHLTDTDRFFLIWLQKTDQIYFRKMEENAEDYDKKLTADQINEVQSQITVFDIFFALCFSQEIIHGIAGLNFHDQ